MSANQEEQEMEAEALEAIYDTHFTRRSASSWAIDLYPEIEINHVACRLVATIPPEYPESAIPIFDIEILQGLASEHVVQLQQMAIDEASHQAGVVCLFAVCERLKEWLGGNNVKGLDDQSMHAQMMRKQQQQQQQQQGVMTHVQQPVFESQLAHDVMTVTEVEEMTVRKRREDGTVCNKENFEAWRDRFDQEMNEAEAAANNNSKASGKATNKKDVTKVDDKSGRLTGFQQFSNKAINLEALEAAAENAEAEEIDLDEELFEDDVDLDDLDFDDEDDDDEELDDEDELDDVDDDEDVDI